MKNRYIYIFMMALFAVFACERVEELSQPEKPQETVEKVEMTFSAVIESDQTKTVLGDSEVENVKKVLWQPEDAIAVSVVLPAPDGGYYESWNSNWVTGSMVMPVERFTAKTTSPVSRTEFDGRVEFATGYKAFYPYSETLADTSNVFYFDMPSVQKYVNGSFDPDAAPMVATASYGETFNFQNLYAVLAVNIKGSDYVKSISFSAFDEWGSPAVITGRYRAVPSHEEPAMTLHKNPGYSLTLDCGEAVQLDPDVATPFYLILPPGTYNSFTLTISTPAGNKMLKSGNNPLTLERSHIKPTGDLEYVETIEVDLSERGNANCYIVPSVGLYRFDADIVGNGEYGYVQNERFYPATPEINPYSVELLWEDFSGMVTNLTLVDGKVCFQASGKEGNAVVAVKDENETILWSWHLWMTDQPLEQIYENSKGTFTVLDRNIGATRADRGEGEEWKESIGTLYQWGRKDPFKRENNYDKRLNSQVYIHELAMNANRFITGSNCWMKEEDHTTNLWTKDQKTIYDPCPIGYRVSVMDVFNGFTEDGQNADRRYKINARDAYDNGYYFYIDNQYNVAWYPIVYYLNEWDANVNCNNDGKYWVADVDNHASSWAASRLYFYYSSDMECSVSLDRNSYDAYANGFPVRCMKDDGHVDLSKPTVKLVTVKDMTNSSATVVAKVTKEGSSEVTERGVILGGTSDINIYTGTYYSVGTGAGEFEYTFTDLEPATRYYVRAYAVNERGESYSDVKSFTTTWEGTAYDLSREGTANCYIVSPIYAEYQFNASVKGNSTEPVGEIASAEVLWETTSTYREVAEGSIISKVSYDYDTKKVTFELPFDAQLGNAVIAVKDTFGTILWSWHIWVVDFDPEITKQTLYNNAVIMDRNLGATGVVPGSVESFGLYYQWGRKDPFVHPSYNWAPSDGIRYEYYDWSNDTIERAVQNPNVVYNDASWAGDATLWGVQKTKYDPCPLGWKVPEKNIYEGLKRSSYNYGYFAVDYFCADSNVYFPAPGYSDGTSSIQENGMCGHLWSSNRGLWIDIYCDNGDIYIRDDSGWGRSVDYLYGVRCMKESPKQSGDNEGYDENEDYEW